MVQLFIKAAVTATKLFFTKNLKMWNWQFSSKTGKSKFRKTHRSKCGWMVASCSSTNQIKGIESFMPTLPDSIGLLNKELREPRSMKLTQVITVSICDNIDTHNCWLSPLHLRNSRHWSFNNKCTEKSSKMQKSQPRSKTKPIFILNSVVTRN